MISRLRAILAATLLAGCAAPRGPVLAETRLADDVSVRMIAPGLWVHTTTATLGGEPVPANGMLLETDSGSVLVDSGWTDEQTSALLAWAERDLRRPVRTAVVTHAHADRSGGIAALRRAGVTVLGHPLTARLVVREGRAAPDTLAGLAAGVVRLSGIELFYPGAGHAPDNIVAYFPRPRVLFGGCLVKADTATTVGNVADADVREWPSSVERVRARFPAAATVVPGHGAIGGPRALAVTEALIRARGPAADSAYRARRR